VVPEKGRKMAVVCGVVCAVYYVSDLIFFMRIAKRSKNTISIEIIGFVSSS